MDKRYFKGILCLKPLVIVFKMAIFVENICVTDGLFLWLLHLKIGRVCLAVDSPVVYSQRRILHHIVH